MDEQAPTDGLTVRPLSQTDDLYDIARICYEAFSTFNKTVGHDIGLDFQSTEAALGFMSFVNTQEGYVKLVADDQSNGRVCGSIFVDLRGDIAGIGNVTVDPAGAQGKGVGKALMQNAVEAAKSANKKGICLQQVAANQASFSLYSKLGFNAQYGCTYLAAPAELDVGDVASDYEVSLFSLPPDGMSSPEAASAEELACDALFQKAFPGSSRLAEIMSSARAGFPFFIAKRKSDGVVAAFATSFFIVGFQVADSEDAFLALLQTAASTHKERGFPTPYFHLPSSLYPGLLRRLLKLGCRLTRNTTLMAFDGYSHAPAPGVVYLPSINY